MINEYIKFSTNENEKALYNKMRACNIVSMTYSEILTMLDINEETLSRLCRRSAIFQKQSVEGTKLVKLFKSGKDLETPSVISEWDNKRIILDILLSNSTLYDDDNRMVDPSSLKTDKQGLSVFYAHYLEERARITVEEGVSIKLLRREAFSVQVRQLRVLYWFYIE